MSANGKTRYGVHIRSWRVPGSATQHHYGRIWRYGGNEQRAEEEVQYILTADEAAELNNKDNDGWGAGNVPLKRGERNGRYRDRERLIRDAVARIREVWNHSGAVECGREDGGENPRLEGADGQGGQPKR